ncbi:MAG: hypothetical protein QOE92_762 [Chloroflexota bacterium]|nr:hypothetical protein [Chloroflexota bacterium]
MKIGIGLPNTVRGAAGDVMVEWARRAEARGFSTVATIGRVAFPSYADLIALAAAAGATSRIALMTDILLGPLHNPAMLAKDVASLDALSGGRFTLGAAVGGRQDDYAVTGVGYEDRGKRWDAALELMHQVWRGEAPAGTDQPIAPPPTNGDRVPVLIGGTSDATLRRVAKWGAGWTAGGAPPEAVAPFAERVRAAWTEAGREGEPRMAALLYFALGDNAEEGARRSLEDYYAFAGPYAKMAAEHAAKTHEAIVGARTAFEKVGVDELIYFPAIAELEQVDMLAEEVGL